MIPHTTLRVAEPPLEVGYWCANGHHTPRMWSAAVAAPDLWECRHCGLPAGRDRAHPPRQVAVPPFKTPLTHLFERRSEAECAALLDEALQRLRARRSGTEPGWALARAAVMTLRPEYPAIPGARLRRTDGESAPDLARWENEGGPTGCRAPQQ